MNIDQVRAHFLSEPVLDAAAAAVEASADVWTGFARNDAKVCLRAALDANIALSAQGHREWVACPVCGEADMRKEADAEGATLIFCVNHNCKSNGGSNESALARPAQAPARLSHEEYVAGCDEGQLENLVERANARLEKIRKSGWVKLWTVSIGWSNVAWFVEQEHGAAVDFARDAVAAEARRRPAKGIEMEVKLENFRPEEVAGLLALTPKTAAPAGAEQKTEG